MASACGASDVPGAVVGRVALLGAMPDASASANAAMLDGLRVVVEWAEPMRDSLPPRLTWMGGPVDDRGTFRICGVPTDTPLVLRVEADRALDVGATPVRALIAADRRFARADLQLEATVVTLATFAGTVLADTTGTPLENAEVTLTDLARTVRTDRRGAFRFHDIPLGPHLVSVKRVGYAPMLTSINFENNRAIAQRVLLNKATTLAAVSVTAGGLPAAFEERRALGLGHFVTTADLDKSGDRRLSDVLATVSGFSAVSGRGGNGWVVGKRAPQHIKPTGVSTGPAGSAVQCGVRSNAPCTFDDNDLREQGYYCPNAAERMQGLECACYSQIFVDNQLMNRGRPTEPFDINSIPARDIAGVEFYASAAQTPGQYSELNARCGVMLIWTRRR